MINIKTFTITVIIFAFMFSTMNIFSGVPGKLLFQGRLLLTDGNPKSDGVYNVIISFYNDENSSTAIAQYSEDVTLKRGIFTVQLDETNGDLPDFSNQYWVGIKLDGEDEMKPRIKLSSVPYSFYAADAEHAQESDTSAYGHESGHALKSDSSLHSLIADTAKFVINDGIPVGTILPYAGDPNKLPPGWMPCDGRAVSSVQYPYILKVIGTSWGDGSNDTDEATDFNLPDLRGRFLRGVDNGSDNDPGADNRQAIMPGGNEGDKVGTVSENLDLNEYVPPAQGSNFAILLSSGNESSSSKPQASLNQVAPANAAVNFIIKVR